jgi:hypothetical protein
MQGWTFEMVKWGRAKLKNTDRFAEWSAIEEKIGVPRHHENMPPGNSFPQICVVSGNRMVENGSDAQGYLRVVALSNPICLLIS